MLFSLIKSHFKKTDIMQFMPRSKLTFLTSKNNDEPKSK